LEREPLFKNKEALRHSYTPHELPHRESEVKQIATILSSTLKGETPSNIILYGKSGTGKTITSRFICDELEKTGRRLKVPTTVVYLNCERADTQYRVLQNLAQSFGERVPFTGWPTDKVYNTLKEVMDKDKRSVLIILDEVDKLVSNNGDHVLYNLTRINSELNNARVSIIGISNDLKFTDYLDARVRSSLGEEEIIFKPYDAKQLEDILKQRAELAFEPGLLDGFVIPLCAAFAAREHGDARRALDLLRVSGEVAERKSAEKVTEEHVRNAKEKIESDTIAEAVRTLPTQSKLVLYSVIFLKEKGEKMIITGEVYDIYKKLCKNVSLDVLTQRRVSDLISELDMLGIFNSKIVSKGRYGRTREIKLECPIENLKIVLDEDTRLRALLNRLG